MHACRVLNACLQSSSEFFLHLPSFTLLKEVQSWKDELSRLSRQVYVTSKRTVTCPVLKPCLVCGFRVHHTILQSDLLRTWLILVDVYRPLLKHAANGSISFQRSVLRNVYKVGFIINVTSLFRTSEPSRQYCIQGAYQWDIFQ